LKPIADRPLFWQVVTMVPAAPPFPSVVAGRQLWPIGQSVSPAHWR